MDAQGSELFNTQYITSLTNQVNAVQSCADLEALVAKRFASLGAMQAAIEADLAYLALIEELLTPPTVDKLVTWITSFITAFLQPYYQPYITGTAQLVQLATAVAGLAAAIEQKAAQFESCSINIPTIP